MKTRLLLTAFLLACGGAPAPAPTATPVATVTPIASVTPSPEVVAAVAATDRTDADRALDAGRQPEQVFSFFGVAPGQSVADLFAGGGYTSEILARIVGPEGRVLVQNNTFVLDRFARAPLAERLARLSMPQLVPVERDFDAPLPEDAQGLDAVIFILAYHDTAWQPVDRAAMNRAIFAALRPGGVYGIVDHAAAVGRGTSDAETLHRIERTVVIEEITAAGFVLDGELDALRNPEDTCDWNASPMSAGERRGTSDRFVLRFVRPE